MSRLASRSPRSVLSGRSGRAALLAALAALLASGCMGLPPGAAGEGDLVTIEYTAYDLATGAVLRDNRTASFVLGAGGSGLGDQVEASVRGRGANETYEVRVVDDASLDYSERVEVNRTLAPIPVHQSAPRSDFERVLGPATVGRTFAAYTIYTGQVTNVTNETVSFSIVATEGQQDPAPAVGAMITTTTTDEFLIRRLDPVEGATFPIAPPSPFQPTTPLGLQAGSYKVVGATEDKLVLSRSASAQTDLIGRDLRVVVRVTEVQQAAEALPTGGNYGVRDSPQIDGDPSIVLAGDGEGGLPTAPPTQGGHGGGH